jgi:chemosensory pili system protein ChpA (sensor histidine kinase/response regulator)
MNEHKLWSNGSAGKEESLQFGDSSLAGEFVPELLGGFVAEVRGYLPKIQHGIDEIFRNPQEAAQAAEPHRFVRIIKGAAAIFDLTVLGNATTQLETVLEKLAKGRIPPTPALEAALNRVMAELNDYLDQLEAGAGQVLPESLSEALQTAKQATTEEQAKPSAPVVIDLRPTFIPASEAAAGLLPPLPDDDLFAELLNEPFHPAPTLIELPQNAKLLPANPAKEHLPEPARDEWPRSGKIWYADTSELWQDDPLTLEWPQNSKSEPANNNASILPEPLELEWPEQNPPPMAEPELLDVPVTEWMLPQAAETDRLSELELNWPAPSAGADAPNTAELPDFTWLEREEPLKARTGELNLLELPNLDWPLDSEPGLGEPTGKLPSIHELQHNGHNGYHGHNGHNGYNGSNGSNGHHSHAEPPPPFAASEPSQPEPEVVAWDIPTDLLEVFLPEAEEHLRLITVSLPNLAAQTENKSLLQEVRRSAHSLKGSAAVVGFHELARLAHRMEDLLDLLYDEDRALTPEMLQLLYASTGALENLLNQKADQSTLQALFASYERLLSELGSETQPEQPAPLVEPAQPVAPQVMRVEPPLPALEPVLIEIPQPTSAESAHNPLELLRRDTMPLAPPASALPVGNGQRAAATARPAAPVAAASQSISADRSKYVRVPIERLDDVVKLVTELIVASAAFEQNMGELNRQLVDLRNNAVRLGRVTTRMETQFEASTLGNGLGVRGSQALSVFEPGKAVFASTPLATNNVYGFDELEFDRYTEFHLLLRELTECSGDIQTLDREMGAAREYFESCLNRQGRLCSDIQEHLMRLRMVPLSTLSSRLHRTVHTVAAQSGKQVNFVLEGEERRLDKTVIEAIADPLLHILRNAIDHGIELPGIREACGKAATGTVRLRAFHEGPQTVIQVSDDGGGLDPERLLQTAISRGFLAPADAARLSKEDFYSLIFLPGFSTASAVSEISGRGVGMDVVKATIHRLKGSVYVDSLPGEGTVFTIRLPMSLAVTRALMVKSCGQTYAVPFAGLHQIVKLTPAVLDRLGNEQMVRVLGKVYPLMQLGKLLRLKQALGQPEGPQAALLMTIEDRQVAIAVDETLTAREVVVKTLGNHLRQVRGITGASLLGDGSAVLILNLPELVRDAFRPRAPQPETKALPRASAPLAAPKQLSVLVVDDSLSVRRVLANRVTSVGWKALQARDGLDALELLQHLPVPPDIILLDIEMPRMDGYEFISTLRKQPAYAQLPVIVLTSRAGQKHRERAFEVGATEYLVKPYQDEVLLGLIRRLVGQRAEGGRLKG